MIEIIREEDTDGATEKCGLPKDIRQIGAPDIGDRIYVEDGAYQFLHPYGRMEEKRAYVLLGKFENYAGRQCVFIEAAIRLEEMEFDGELPQWSDHTWAYIYKRLRCEYDSMVIVGWAIELCGQLPNLTSRIENLHRHNFGGAHQVLFLMDSLEQEEAFYGSRDEHLSRREGFYIYYEKSRSAAKVKRLEETRQKEKAERDAVVEQDTGMEWKTASEQETKPARKKSYSPQEETNGKLQKEQVEELTAETQKVSGETESGRHEAPEETESGWQKVFAERFAAGKETAEHGGNYRKQLAAQEERAPKTSYASTALLVAVVGALGITAYLNHTRMAAMEATLAQMNHGQVLVAEQSNAEETESAEAPEVTVETVVGDVQKQEMEQSGAETGDAAALNMTADQGAVAAPNAAATSNVAADPSAPTAALNAPAPPNTAAVSNTAAAAPNTPAAAPAPAESTAVTPDTAAPVVSESQTYLNQGYYVVQKGDSLVGICRKIYQTTAMMEKLCEVNAIEDRDAIYAGQYLKLPN